MIEWLTVFLTKQMFVITMVMFSFCVLWLMVEFKKNKIVVALLAPVVLSLAFYTFISIKVYEGYPASARMPRKFALIWYNVHGKKYIFMWVKATGDTYPRVHTLPYSKKLHKKLRKMRKALAAGKVPIRGTVKTKGKKGTPYDEMKFHKFKPKIFGPKEAPTGDHSSP